jgi:cytochrome c oxidase cbb3-type subunit 1
LVGSVFALIGSIKFHGPDFLAETPWLTYGRVRPTHIHTWLYGFGVQAGMATMIWLFTRLGRVTLQQPFLALLGGLVWNLGVLLGAGGILSGDLAGYENVQMPGYAAGIMFAGYLLIGFCAALTLHQRQASRLYVAEWFLIVALFWFPWIFSSVQLLIHLFPTRGLAVNVVAWWFAENLQVLWFWSIGFAVLLYFIPKLTGNPLHSRYTALFTFWMLLLFAGWGGIPYTAPLPSWMPVLSNIGVVLTGITVLTMFLNIHRTLTGNWKLLGSDVTLKWLRIAIGAIAFASTARIVVTLIPTTRPLELTWFEYGRLQLNNYGFYFLTLFAAMYFIVPRLLGKHVSPGLVRAHWWLTVWGVALAFLPLMAGGMAQGMRLQNSDLAFLEISRGTLHYLRLSTVGDTLLMAGHLILLLNLVTAAASFYRARAAAAVSAARADLIRNPVEARA